MYFPTTIPTCMSLWTNNILVRHGDVVESFAIELDDDWLYCPSRDRFHSDEHDNYQAQRGGNSRDWERISYVSVVQLLVMCPKIQSLEIVCPGIYAEDFEEPEDPDYLIKVENLHTRLLSLTSRKPRLRRLKLDNHQHKIPN